jgi:predicted nucleic acid-binding protein
MKPGTFVDTSAWYAITDPKDTNHQQATERLRRLSASRRTFITTNHVVSETYTLLRSRLGFSAAQQFLQRTRASALTRRVFVPEAWEEAAEDLLRQYDDQDFSYVDATSFIAMRRLEIQEALAFDHHFTVLGFIVPGD